MATIGSLAVNVVAKTDKLVSGLNSAKSQLDGFVSKITGVQAAVTGLVSYGFASLVSTALEAGGALYDLSLKLHISTEAIGALDYAVQQIGGSTDAMHGALTRLTRKLGEANAGAAAARQAFAAIGLEYQNLMQMPIEQQFIAVIDALHKLPTAEQQAAAGTAIFGKSFAELNAIVAAGGDEIRKYGLEAAQTGALISSENAQALDDAADAVSAFSAQWEALKTNMVATFAPAITGVMYVITNAIGAMRAVWYATQGAIIAGMGLLTNGLIKIAEVWNAVAPESMQADLTGLKTTLDSFNKAYDEKNQQIKNITGGGGNPLAAPSTTPSQQAITKEMAERQTKALESIVKNTATTDEGDTIELGTVGVR